MSVNDFEEAASMVVSQSKQGHDEVSEPLEKVEVEVNFETTLNPKKIDTDFMRVEEVQEVEKIPAPEKPQGRRNREFKGKKREREDTRSNNQSFTAPE